MSLFENSNDSGVRVVHFTTSENLVVKAITFLYQNICKYTWISPDWKTHIQIDHILIDRRWHSSILQVSWQWSDHCLVVAKVWEKLLVKKQVAQKV